VADKQKTATENATLWDLIPKLDVNKVGVVRLSEWKGTKLEESALNLLPQARSAVVFAKEIYPEILALVSPGRTMGAASLHDLLDSNTEFISGRLTRAAYDTAGAFHSIGLKALPLPARGCPMDARFLEAVFSYKHAGQAAGLGKLGWHSLLITPDFGSRVRLSCCLTEAELEPTNADITIECDSCGICLDSCPAGALTKPQSGEQYSINKFACNSFRSASGGCSECMRLCPMGG